MTLCCIVCIVTYTVESAPNLNDLLEHQIRRVNNQLVASQTSALMVDTLNGLNVIDSTKPPKRHNRM